MIINSHNMVIKFAFPSIVESPILAEFTHANSVKHKRNEMKCKFINVIFTSLEKVNK